MAQLTWGLIIASGKTEQLVSGSDAAMINLGDKPLLAYSLLALEESKSIQGIAIVVARDRMQNVKALSEIMGVTKLRRIVAGTAQRITSIQKVIDSIDSSVSTVVIQDVTRPLIRTCWVDQVVKASKRTGCAVIAQKFKGSGKIVERGSRVSSTIKAGTCWEAQSPQAYKTELLKKGLALAAKKKKSPTDESELIEAIKGDVQLVPGSLFNIKIESADDLALAHALQQLDFSSGMA